MSRSACPPHRRKFIKIKIKEAEPYDRGEPALLADEPVEFEK